MLNEGANVVVASLDPARNAKAVDTLKAKSNGRVGMPTDLNDPAAVEALFKTRWEFGRLDIRSTTPPTSRWAASLR
jgi:NAD(P)-dependent dehydrogenase (short-subunit alcohol dehydrogenase family)